LQEASAVKWSIVAAIFLIAFLWFVGGYYHAQSRMKKGMPPLAYHRVGLSLALPFDDLAHINFSGLSDARNVSGSSPRTISSFINNQAGTTKGTMDTLILLQVIILLNHEVAFG
jgi:hypothetical protein